VATVVVADDPDTVAPAADQLPYLKIPGILVQAKAVQKYDSVASGARTPITDAQRHAVLRSHYAFAGERTVCAGPSPTRFM
jgi:hypothetical protein